jgi:hypothetical protein
VPDATDKLRHHQGHELGLFTIRRQPLIHVPTAAAAAVAGGGGVACTHVC